MRKEISVITLILAGCFVKCQAANFRCTNINDFYSLLRPQSTINSNIQKPIPMPRDYVSIRDLGTAKIETIARQRFLKLLNKKELPNVEVEGYLDNQGALYLGRRNNKRYIVHIFDNHKNGRVRYQIYDNVATNVVLLAENNVTALKAHTLAIVNDLEGRPVDSFLYTDKLPSRIIELIGEGKVASIDNLVIGNENMLIFSAKGIYDFRSQGNLAGKKVTSYFKGGNEPLSFSVSISRDRAMVIEAKDVSSIPTKLPEPVTEGVRGEKGVVLRTDFEAPQPEISPAEQEEIRKAVEKAVSELPAEKKALARAIVEYVGGFMDLEGKVKTDRLAEYLEVPEDDINKIFELLLKTEALIKIAEEYTPQLIFFLRKETKEPAEKVTAPLPMLPRGYAYVRNLDTNELYTLDKTGLNRRYRLKQLNNVEVIYDSLNGGGTLFMGRDRKGKAIMPFSFTKHPHRRVRYIIRNKKVDKTTVLLLDGEGNILLDDKTLYAKDLDTGKIRCHLPVDVPVDVAKKLDNVEIFNKRLTSGGALLVGAGRGKLKSICRFTAYPYKKVRYQIHKGKIDKTTIILLDDDRNPLKDGKITYAADPETGQIRCHIPEIKRWDIFKKLNNAVIFDTLDSGGNTGYKSRYSKRHVVFCTFLKHAKGRIRYHVQKGNPDRTTTVLLNKNDKPIEDDSIRHILYPDGSIKCHLPEKLYRSLLRKFEGQTAYQRLPKGGTLNTKHDRHGNAIETISFSRYEGKRVKYQIDDAEIDGTTVLILNDDGTIFEDDDLRFAVDLDTRKIRCHLPTWIYRGLAKKLDNVEIYDRLSKSGSLYQILGKRGGHYSIWCCARHGGGRVKYKVFNGRVDVTTIILLNEDGSILEDKEIRYAIDLDTASIRCHLPSRLYYEYRKQLDNVEIRNDRLDAYGIFHLGITKEGNPKYIVAFRDQPGKEIRYQVHKGEVDKTTVIILDDNGKPLMDDKRPFAVDLKMSKIKCHLPYNVTKSTATGLNDVEIMNEKLDRNGVLSFGGVRVYRCHKYRGKKICFRIFNNKFISIRILSDKEEILTEEIFDEALMAEAFPKESPIDYIVSPKGWRVLTYALFLDRLYCDFLAASARLTEGRLIVDMLQNTLYEFLNPNVYFFFGQELKENEQKRLKSKIFQFWKDIDRISERDLKDRLLELTQIFAESARSVIGKKPESLADLPERMKEDIESYIDKARREGALHAINIDLPEPKKISIKHIQTIFETAA